MKNTYVLGLLAMFLLFFSSFQVVLAEDSTETYSNRQMIEILQENGYTKKEITDLNEKNLLEEEFMQFTYGFLAENDFPDLNRLPKTKKAYIKAYNVEKEAKYGFYGLILIFCFSICLILLVLTSSPN